MYACMSIYIQTLIYDYIDVPHGRLLYMYLLYVDTISYARIYLFFQIQLSTRGIDILCSNLSGNKRKHEDIQ